MKIASQLIVGFATIHLSRSCCPEPRAAERDCEAPINVKGSRQVAFHVCTCTPYRCQGFADYAYDTKAVKGASPLLLTLSFPHLGLSVDGYWPPLPG